MNRDAMVELRESCDGVDWTAVRDVLRDAGMAFHEPDKHRRAFEGAYAVVFAYDNGTLIGCGRALSDGVYQAALYDIAVLPCYQGSGLGRRLVEALLAGLGDCNVILYASPGKEGFYRKLGFRGMKTGMARFVRIDAMAERGFTD
jgi:ribosomal protein S18 acetylase RimI-like enzyme